MELLKCKTCGSFGMVPMEVSLDEASIETEAVEPETRFYTCHVCGDNWLSVRETHDAGDCHITFIHQMGMEPVLKRVGHMQEATSRSVDDWQYYLDDEAITELDWREELRIRRKVLKAICTN